jgi:hypothetical protein
MEDFDDRLDGGRGSASLHGEGGIVGLASPGKRADAGTNFASLLGNFKIVKMLTGATPAPALVPPVALPWHWVCLSVLV